MNTPSLHDYYNMLEAHDWFYSYSDDHRAYTKGIRKHYELQVIAERSPAHMDLYKAYYMHMHSNAGKPVRP